jgi:FtsP/CotA-like multicopper oxidase with cupredoxin domain
VSGSSGNSTSGASPFGNKTTTNTNPYTGAPDTGVTRNYEFTLSRGQLAPDGYLRDVILVNGGFPGPLIEANWGDKISVNVFNNISGEDEGTTLHWHGFLQTGTPEMDGVPGITQCPIAPGRNFTYEFTAEIYGSSWYHSHYSAQYSGGAVGPIVVYGPNSASYDIDIGPVMLSDWYHRSEEDIVDAMLQPENGPEALDVVSDNNLINGRGNFDCSTVASGDNTPCVSNAGVAKFNFVRGKTHRLRLVNSGSAGVQRFSIDSHTMTVIANDFVPIQPYNTTVVTLGVGQRTDVLVTANAAGNGTAFWMRSNITCAPANQPFAVAAIYYNGASTNSTPTSSAWDEPAFTSCGNDDLTLTQPLFAIDVAEPDVTQIMDIGLTVNGTNVTLITFNGVAAKVDYNAPVLPATVAGNLTFPEEVNVINFAENSTIRIVVSNPGPLAHPMHLHGHNFQILNFGNGTTWDGTIINSANPMRRDTALVEAGGYLAIQFVANPGSWAWHCHIAWHASAGFMSVLNVGVDEVEQMVLPASIGQTCTDWSAYTSQYIVDDTDSGV